MFLDKPIRICQTLFVFLTSIKAIHLCQHFSPPSHHLLGKQNTPSIPPNSLFTSLSLSLSLSMNPFFTSTKSATRPHPFHRLLFTTIAPHPLTSPFSVYDSLSSEIQRLFNGVTLDWTSITTFSYGNCSWFDFFFLSPFLILGFLVFCFCSSWLLCCVAPLKFMCEGVGRIREKGFWP